MALSDDEVRLLPTLAVDGPWLLKQEYPDELRVWVHEFGNNIDMKQERWINEEWIATSYRVKGKWEVLPACR